jgi:hypothetical protein
MEGLPGNPRQSAGSTPRLWVADLNLVMITNQFVRQTLVNQLGWTREP